MIIRKSVNHLSHEQRRYLIMGIKRLKAETGHRTSVSGSPINSYDYYVDLHRYSMANGAAHRAPAFLPWHRSFLLRFESDLRRVLADANFSLPYWDSAADASLADPRHATIWGDDIMGGDGMPVATGPFKAGDWILSPRGDLARTFGLGIRSLPAKADVRGCLEEAAYDHSPWDMSSPAGLRNRLEGWISPNGEPQMHNRVHVWIGGSMGPATSPNDPVFFLHHCNVDRIWAQWQSLHTNTYLPTSGAPSGHNLNDRMVGLGEVTPADMLDVARLGYAYDETAAGALDPVRSQDGQTAVSVTFRNDSPFTVKVMWVDYQGQEKQYASLSQHTSYHVATGATHPWRVYANGGNLLVCSYVATTAPHQDVSIRWETAP